MNADKSEFLIGSRVCVVHLEYFVLLHFCVFYLCSED